jgi:hypothetical protein
MRRWKKMALKITTIDDHQKAIDRCTAIWQDRVRRIDEGTTDWEDGFLSDWANDMTSRANHTAIQKLRYGEEVGSDKPHDWHTFLYEGETCLWAKVISTQFGRAWLILDEDFVARTGRRFIPIGGGSRIQKTLGLHEESHLVEVKPFLVSCGGQVGSPLSYYTIPLNDPTGKVIKDAPPKG